MGIRIEAAQMASSPWGEGDSVVTAARADWEAAGQRCIHQGAGGDDRATAGTAEAGSQGTAEAAVGWIIKYGVPGV